MAFGFRAGILSGMGLSLVAAFVLPRWGRPAAKATIKGGLAAYESANETVARLRETLSDIVAEAAFERAAEHERASDSERGAAVARSGERQAADEAQPVPAK